MKYKNYFLILICCIACSCSNDNDNKKEVEKDLIIGTWGMYISEFEGEDSGFQEKDPNLTANQISFSQDGKITSIFGEQSQGTWENNNDGSYKFVVGGNPEIIKINFLTKNEMVIEHQEHEKDYYQRIE